MWRRCNPFRGLPNPREVWAWGMYDLANQSFTLLITTLFFGVYFKTVVVADPARGELLWGRAFSIASLIVVLISPLVGAVADAAGSKKAFLLGTGAGCIALTACLGLAGPGDIALAMTLYIAANVLFMTGENFLGAFLPELSTRQTVGRVSAIGWTMGYLGALLCLPLSLLIPGVAQQTNAGYERVFLFAAAWFLIASVPTALFLRERARPAAPPRGPSIALAGFLRLARTAREIRRFRALAAFLAVFFVYSCGVQVVIVFSGIIAAKQLSGPQLVGFIWMLAAVSGAAAFLAALLQDRVGHARLLALALVVWLLTTLGGAAMPVTNAPLWWLGLVGLGVGVGLGLVGTASRALVGVMTPAARSAEFFGFWGLAYKGAGALGPLLYGIVASAAGQRVGLLLVAGCFAAGLAGLALVRVDAGRRAAEDAELESAPAPHGGTIAP